MPAELEQEQAEKSDLKKGEQTMEQSFKRVTRKNGEVVKNLYLKARDGNDGEWRRSYIVIFRDKLHGKSRRRHVGSNLQRAIEERDELLKKNRDGFDFEKEKQERVDAKLAFKAAEDAQQQAHELKKKTLGWWLPKARALPEMTTIQKGLHAGKQRRESTKYGDRAKHYHLERLLGNVPIKDFNQSHIDGYRDTRLGETLIRWRKPTKHLVQPGTVGLEMTALKWALDLARKHADEFDLEVPKAELLSFSGKPKAGTKERTLTPVELR